MRGETENCIATGNEALSERDNVTRVRVRETPPYRRRPSAKSSAFAPRRHDDVCNAARVPYSRHERRLRRGHVVSRATRYRHHVTYRRDATHCAWWTAFRCRRRLGPVIVIAKPFVSQSRAYDKGIQPETLKTFFWRESVSGTNGRDRTV